MLRKIPLILVAALLAALMAGCGGDDEEGENGGNGGDITKEKLDTLWSVYFGSEQEGWAVGEKNTIIHTTDAGNTWESQTENISWLNAEPGNNIFFNIKFTDQQNGWVVGGLRGGAGALLKTNDGGATWEQVDVVADVILRDITLQSDPSIGDAYWIVGLGGLILYSPDGGASWVTQDSPVSKDLFSVASIGYYQGGFQVWASGQDGTILHTGDGVTWNEQDSQITTSLQSIHFVNTSKTERAFRGWAVGLSGEALATSDMGQRWNDQDAKVQPGEHLRDVFFLNETMTGWIVGDGGRVIFSTNGGSEWRLRPSSVFKGLYGVHFVDARKGWAVGQEGVVVSTVDGGSNWKILRGSAF
jgi:photosystem II stability/assembly factor-like uncharacterized protein